MFHLYDFLIYCFITAYTPGANNLLSMSNAIRLGFRRSIRFNLGILAGFSAVMTVCTAFSATLYSYLPRVKTGMQILGAAYMLYLAWKFCGFTYRRRKGGQFYFRHDTAICQSQNLYLRNHGYVALYPARLSFPPGIDRIYDSAFSHRRLRIFCLGTVWSCIL